MLNKPDQKAPAVFDKISKVTMWTFEKVYITMKRISILDFSYHKKIGETIVNISTWNSNKY